MFSQCFFSSRRRHTRLVSDWSSDVCSSDLNNTRLLRGLEIGVNDYLLRPVDKNELMARARTQIRKRRYTDHRSEERRVGKECRYRWSREENKKKKKKHETICTQNSGSGEAK